MKNSCGLQAFVKKNFETSTIDVKVQYKEVLCEKFKAIHGKSFDSITGIWSFPLSEHKTISSILEEECDSVNIVKWFPLQGKTAKYTSLKNN